MRRRFLCFLTTILAICATPAMCLGSSGSAAWRIAGDLSGLSLEFSGRDAAIATIDLRWAHPDGVASPGLAHAPGGPIIEIHSGLASQQPASGHDQIHEVFPGIDVELHGRQGVPEFDFLVSPYANPSVITYTFGEEATASLLPGGELCVRKGGLVFTQRKPLAWQQIDGVEQPVTVAFHLAASGAISFTLGSYREDLPLVIDPTVEFSSNLVISPDHAFKPIQMAKAPSGDILILGVGDESSLPQTGPSYKPFPDKTTSLVLARIDGRSYQLLSRTFLPSEPRYVEGPGGFQLTVDSSGSVWVGMTVLKTSFPALNPPIGAFTDSPLRSVPTVFLMRFNADTSAITYSSYAGCQDALYANSLSAGVGNDLVLAGVTACTDFPVSSGAFQIIRGETLKYVGYVMKLDSATGAVRFSTYFGGDTQLISPDFRAVAAPDGRVLVASSTNASPFPVSAGAYQDHNLGGMGIYIGALTPDGGSLSFGSYFGGSDSYGVALTELFPGPNNSVSFSGKGYYGQIPLSPGAFSLPAGYDAQHFIARISSDGKRLESSAIVHSGYNPIAVTILPNGDAVFSATGAGGHGAWSDGAFSVAPQTATAGSLMLGRLSADGKTLLFSSMYPGKSMSSGSSLFLDAGKVAFTGIAGSGVLRSSNAWPGTGVASDSSQRSGFLVAMDFDSPTRCSYSVQTNPQRFPNRTSSGQLLVTTQPGCPWIVSPTYYVSLPEFPTESGAIGTANFPIKIPLNISRSDRTIEIAVGSTVFPLLQDAGTCDVFEVFPEQIAFTPIGTGVAVNIRTPDGCTWKGGPSSAWFADIGHFSYNNTFGENWGSYSFAATAFPNSFEARSGVLPLGNRIISITQEAGSCTSSVSPASLDVAKEGGEYNLELQTVGSNCAWQTGNGPGVQASNAYYGIGSATVPIRVEANPTNTPRETHFILANKRIPILQSAGNCTASFASSELVVPHVGGWRGTSFLATGDACTWNPTTNASWIQFPALTMGSATLFLTVEPNLSPLPRTAVVRNLGATITVTQLGNDAAYILLSGPWEWPIKINGIDARLDYETNLPIGTQLSLQPQPWRLETTGDITRVTRWSDGEPPSRTLTVSTNSLTIALESEALRRIPVEKVNGGSVNLTPAMGSPAIGLPEYYASDYPGTPLFYTATAVPEEGYRFVGWIVNPMNGYFTELLFPGSQPDGRVLRPRFERIVAPSEPYLVPELLDFVEYPLAPINYHYVEFRGLPLSIARIHLDGICPGSRRLFTGVAAYPLASDRMVLGFRPDQDVLLQLGQGIHQCTLTVDYDDRVSRTIPMTIRIEGVPAVITPPEFDGIRAITNAATFDVGPISPGALFTAFGMGLASGIAHAPSIPLPQLLKDAQIRIYSTVDYVERYSELLYVSPTQINFHVPEDLPIGGAEVRLYRSGSLISTSPVQVVNAVPGVFWAPIYNGFPAPSGYGVLVSGDTQARTEIYHCTEGQDTCLLQPPSFGQPQDQLFLSIYATGLRNLKKSDIRVTANGVDLPVDYLGAQGYFIGLDQVNLRIPRILAGSGETLLEMLTPTGTVTVGRVQF